MNAIEILTADHAVVADLFEEVEATDEKEHPAIFLKIRNELVVHAHIEETIFYPRLKATGTSELIDVTVEGIGEHHQIKIFLKELASLSENNEKFEPKLKVLLDSVAHHVREEEGEMFPLVKIAISSEELEELGASMAAEKKNFKLQASARSSGS